MPCPNLSKLQPQVCVMVLQAVSESVDIITDLLKEPSYVGDMEVSTKPQDIITKIREFIFDEACNQLHIKLTHDQVSGDGAANLPAFLTTVVWEVVGNCVYFSSKFRFIFSTKGTVA